MLGQFGDRLAIHFSETSMSLISEIRARFAIPLSQFSADVESLLEMIRPSTDAKFGDYQVNCAMSLQKLLQKPPQEIAQELIDAVSLDDFCDKIEVAGPGFINLTITDAVLRSRLDAAFVDERLGVRPIQNPQTILIDYSSPNVAKPMHVGHIRSTVIGDALRNILRFVGHRVITDNHLGDWGTQFGMVIYGYKHFLDESAYQSDPVRELGRLYQLVRKLIDFHEAKVEIVRHQQALDQAAQSLTGLQRNSAPTDKDAAKQYKKELETAQQKVADLEETILLFKNKIDTVEGNSQLIPLAGEHASIGEMVLEETAKLHRGDAENKQLWNQVLPHCLQDIARIYQRLEIQFDFELGESFYHDMLADVVTSLESNKMITVSDGAKCIFADEFDTPMIVQKKDGAYLYATTDLATIEYRVKQWNPDLILYVVDHRQHEHFEKLFAAARRWGYENVRMIHVQFGTVLGEDKKPMKTRDGDTIGLEGLLDEAVSRALQIVSAADDAKPGGGELSAEVRQEISRVVGLGALKYADLSQNRSSDYVFNYDKMLAMKGNTATYLQYSYARVQGIVRRGNYDLAALRAKPGDFEFDLPIARRLALMLLRFEEALEEVQKDFRPNLLANYLFELTETFFKFYGECSVKDAPLETLRNSRLQLCDLTARTIQQGLRLLGISVVDRM